MTLGEVRDIAATIVLLEWFLLGLVPAAAAYLAVRGLARLLPRLALWLRTGYVWAVRLGQIVRQVTHWLLAPILFLSGLRAGLEQSVAFLSKEMKP